MPLDRLQAFLEAPPRWSRDDLKRTLRAASEAELDLTCRGVLDFVARTDAYLRLVALEGEAAGARDRGGSSDARD